VRCSNQAAIALYKKKGFRQLSKRKNYYQNPVEDALVMYWGEE
jgi:ribosomal-protein-alanine N-acetyltransferase